MQIFVAVKMWNNSATIFRNLSAVYFVHFTHTLLQHAQETGADI